MDEFDNALISILKVAGRPIGPTEIARILFLSDEGKNLKTAQEIEDYIEEIMKKDWKEYLKNRKREKTMIQTFRVKTVRHLKTLATRDIVKKELDGWTLIEAQKGKSKKEIIKLLSPFEQFRKDLKDWLKALKHDFETYENQEDGMFEFISNVPGRRGYDRILIRGIEGAIEVKDILDLEKAHKEKKTDEAWLISIRQVTPAARKEVKENKDIFVYTFDELIDEHAIFDKYFEWLEKEIKSKGIDKYYVYLACRKPEFDLLGKSRGESRWDRIEQYLNLWLDDPTKEHISLLGEFGTGKTWFALHYAWAKLREYKKAREEGRKRPRLPIVVPLRDYAKAVSVESLFSEFFFRKHEIPLPGYSAFELLNRMGKFTLIFDGFDEMARKVDYQTVVNNFWELAKVVVPGSKAILTCRTEHFRYSQESRDILSARVKAATSNIILEPPMFEVAHIEKLSDDQIKELIIKRRRDEIGQEAAEEIAQKIIDHPYLLDLARRPVLIEFILDSFPEIEKLEEINLAEVFYYAVKKKLRKDILEERTFTSILDKVYFMCELAWEMLSKNELTLNYKRFPERIRGYFGEKVEDTELDHWYYDLMRQTMLVRDTEGNYSFAHKSLAEFFVAFKFAAEMGVLKHEFMDLVCDGNAKGKEQSMTWSGCFSAKKCKPLGDFKTENIEVLVKNMGRTTLIPEIRLHLTGMVDKKQWARLVEIVKMTKNKKFEEGEYIGSNAATLLNDCEEFDGKNKFDFSGCILRYADFYGADLKGCKFAKTDLQNATLHSCDLSDANFSGAILKNANLNNTILKNANFSNADLKGASFDEMAEVINVAWSSDGKYIVTGGDDALIRIWDPTKVFRAYEGGQDTTKQELMKEVAVLKGHQTSISSICLSPDRKYISSADRNGEIILWSATDFSKLWSYGEGGMKEPIEKGIWALLFEDDSNFLYVGQMGKPITILNVEDGSPISASNDSKQWTYKTVVGLAKSFYKNIYIVIKYDNQFIIIADNEIKKISLPEKSGWKKDVSISYDDKYFSTASQCCSIKIWEIETLNEILISNKYFSLVGEPDELRVGEGDLTVCFHPHKPYLAIAGEARKGIRIFNYETKEKIISLSEHVGRIWMIRYSIDGKFLVSGSSDKTIKIWDVSPNSENFGKCLHTIKQQINCKGMKIDGAKGLDRIIRKMNPWDEKDLTLREFLIERGAIK